MRIGIDATAAVRQRAGVGRFARGLLYGLSRIDAHNQYVLLTAGKPRLQLGEHDLPRHSAWRRLPVSERMATAVWQRLRLPISPLALMGRLSMFFSPDYTLPPLGRLPSVVTVHDLSFLTHPECADAALRNYLSTVVPGTVQRAAAVVAVSHTTAAALQDLLRVPSGQITIVHNGLDQRFRPARSVRAGEAPACVEHLSRLLALTPGYLLTVGTLEPRKNLIRLLQAFALLRRERQGLADPAALNAGDNTLRLVIAGREGWLYEPIFREVARLGLGKWVRFFTRVEDDDLLALYHGAAAFIFPSLYEGFGIPPLEAMACGVPVASSNGGALPEVLDDAALAFDPLDVQGIAASMDRLLRDQQLREDLKARGLQRAARFRWEDSAAQALGLFERLSA